MTLISASDLIYGLSILEEKIKWVKCPLCEEEYSKLRPCTYWSNSPNPVSSSVCIECAELPYGLCYFEKKYPVPGVSVDIDLMPMYKTLDEKFITNRSYKAIVKYDRWSFMIWKNGQRLFVLEDGAAPDQSKSYDNNYQVWNYLKTAITKGKDVEIDQENPKVKKWGKWNKK